MSSILVRYQPVKELLATENYGIIPVFLKDALMIEEFLDDNPEWIVIKKEILYSHDIKKVFLLSFFHPELSILSHLLSDEWLIPFNNGIVSFRVTKPVNGSYDTVDLIILDDPDTIVGIESCNRQLKFFP